MKTILVLVLCCYNVVKAEEMLAWDDFHRVLRDYGGGYPGGNGGNPAPPVWCGNGPQNGNGPCQSGAIPICCGPCFQGVGLAPAPGPAATPASNPGPPSNDQKATPLPPPVAPPPGVTATPFVPPNAAVSTPLTPPVSPPAGVTPTPFVPPGGSTPAPSKENCPIGCPDGWVSWAGASDHCYLMPVQPARLSTFWDQQKYCKDKEPTSYVVVSNGVIEQVVGSAIMLQYAPTWFAQLTNAHLWLGGYTTPEGKWKFLDDSDQSLNPFFIAAGLAGCTKNGTCIGADPKTLGVWQPRPCDDVTGAVVCEMPKRPVCGAQGGLPIPFSGVDLSPAGLANVIPKGIGTACLGIGSLLGGNPLGGLPVPVGKK